MNRRENAATTVTCGLVEEIVRTFGEIRLRVFGTSMVPSILPGDLISIQRVGISEISNGEIVLYSREGRMFVHRVVSRVGSAEQSLLITRGDRLRHDDSPVSSNELLGRVTSIDRGNQRLEPSSEPIKLNHPLVRLLQTSDSATYLFLRLSAIWGRFVSQTFGRDAVRLQSGFCRTGILACPPVLGRRETGLARVSDPLKSNESFDLEHRAANTKEVVECRA